MGSDAPDLGKGLFGYRRSAVQQIISDRDVMLRQADGRVRAAESRVAELEDELSGIRERSRRMEEQLERLRSMVERTAAGQPPVMEAMPQDAPPSDATVAFEEEAPAQDALDDQALAQDALDDEPFDEPEPALMMETPAEGDAAEAPAPYDVLEYDSDFGTTESGFDPEDLAAQPEAESEPEVGTYAFSYDEPLDATAYSEEELPVQPDDAVEASYEVAAEGTFDELDVAPLEGAGEADVPLDTFDEEEEKEEEPVSQQTGVEVGADYGAEGANSPNSSDITARFLTEELAGILTAAEESAARIVERAHASTEQQLAEANRLWREVQAEVARFAAWRQEVEPLIDQVREKVGEVRERVEAVPERIREALAPMADAISSVDAELAELGAAAPPPLLVSPPGLEADADWDAAGMEMTDYEPGSLTDQDLATGSPGPDESYTAEDLFEEETDPDADTGAA